MSLYGTPVGLNALPLNPIPALRDPTATDVGYNLGQPWNNSTNNTYWVVTSYSGGQANWEDLTASGSSSVATLTGNTGVATPSSGNINVVGTGALNFVGSGSTVTGTITPGTALASTLTGSTGGALSPTAGNFTLAAGTGMLSTAGSGSTITFNVNFAAPPALGSGTPAAVTGTTVASTGAMTAGTGLTATTGNITASTGNLVATLGSVSAATTVTATLGNITATNGNFVGSTAGTGLQFNANTATGAAASPVVLNSRAGQVIFTSVSIAAAADLTLTITNSAITASTTQVIYSMSGATTGAALSIKSVTNSSGSSAIVVTNGTGATTSTSDITMNFIVVN